MSINSFFNTVSVSRKTRHYQKTPEKRAGTPTSDFMTSLLVTLTGHVTSGSHIDYAQWYILHYYYRKKKNAGKSRACAEHTSMTSLPMRAASGHFWPCAIVRSPIPRNMA